MVSDWSCIREARRLSRGASGPATAEQGFVLPFVLLTIAAIALVATAAYNAITRSTQYMRSLQDQARRELAIANAEAETLYRFMTSAGTERGMRAGAPGDPVGQFQFGQTDEEGLEPAFFWPADGGRRHSDTTGLTVVVSYRDSTGLVPINGLEREDLQKFLLAIGFDRDGADRLAAQIIDYRDSDFTREFLGAERSDYRLYQKTPPSDSPLRSVLELARLLSIPSNLGDGFWEPLAAITTTNTRGTLVNGTFAHPFLRERFLPLLDSFSGNALSDAITTDSYPSDRARFLLRLSGPDAVSRIIDVEKTVNDVERPYYRILVAEQRWTGEIAPASPSLGAADQTDPDRPALDEQAGSGFQRDGDGSGDTDDEPETDAGNVPSQSSTVLSYGPIFEPAP